MHRRFTLACLRISGFDSQWEHAFSHWEQASIGNASGTGNREQGTGNRELGTGSESSATDSMDQIQGFHHAYVCSFIHAILLVRVIAHTNCQNIDISGLAHLYSEVSPVRFRPSCSSKKSLKTHFPAIHTCTTWYMHILYIQLHNDRQSSSSTNVPQCTRGYIATEATNTVVKVRISAYTVCCGRIMYSNTCTVYLLHIIVPYNSSSAGLRERQRTEPSPANRAHRRDQRSLS